MRKFLQYFFVVCGCCFLLYSPISTWLEERRVQGLLEQMDNYLSEIDPNDYSDFIDEAVEYNSQLWKMYSGTAETNVTNNLLNKYDEILNINGAGLIGKIEVPSVDIDLPIYHGEENEILATSVGHHPGSAFPVGTENSRVVLSAHTGLATPKLFTRIDELVEGDLFFISVLDQTYAYQVFDIQVILPTETDAIDPVEGEDLVTLLTCTPYGINSHRLLVTGRRIEFTEEEIEEALNETDRRFSWHEVLFYYLPIVVTILILIVFLVVIVLKILKREKEKEAVYEKINVALPGRSSTPPPPIPNHLRGGGRKH